MHNKITVILLIIDVYQNKFVYVFNMSYIKGIIGYALFRKTLAQE